MITPQRHLPPSSRLHSNCRYNLIHCSTGSPDTIMQHVGTVIITVFPERRMKKTDKKKEDRKNRVMMGRMKLTIRSANSDESKHPVGSCSYTFRTSTTVYLPWLPVIIINMSFSSRRLSVGC